LLRAPLAAQHADAVPAHAKTNMMHGIRINAAWASWKVDAIAHPVARPRATETPA